MDVNSIRTLAVSVRSVTNFFCKWKDMTPLRLVYKKYLQEIQAVEMCVIEQGDVYASIVKMAVTEAETGHLVARDIAHLLNKVEKGASTATVQDLLEEVQGKVEAQLLAARGLKAGYEAVNKGLLNISVHRQKLEDKVREDHERALDKRRQAERRADGAYGWGALLAPLAFFSGTADDDDSDESYYTERMGLAEYSMDALRELQGGIKRVVIVEDKHVDFWAQVQLYIQATQVAPEKTIKQEGGVRYGVLGKHREEWETLGTAYAYYASQARASERLLEVHLGNALSVQ